MTLPAGASALAQQTALAPAPRLEAASNTPPARSPRQLLVATLTQTIATAHAAGDLATAQIAARTLSKLLSAPQVAPVVDLASTRHARF
ncbi:hypothetical protein [Sorangium sp. So ce145]|uniref:hypothetical protein n=1 Tax=Sorangium sp. So ce145 TaxID=3133285 RepID=UPI003F61F7B2